MVEPVTTVGGAAIVAYLSKDGLEKLLGPTAEYLGEGLKDFTKRRVENVNNIFKKAFEKSEATIDSPGTVAPKVLSRILNEGSYANDSISVEYFSGILASSRTENGRDDRGARMAKLVDSLSTYQIRTHYLIYHSIREVFKTSGLSLNMNDRSKMEIFIPFSGFIRAMDFSVKEKQEFEQILTHIFFGLDAEALIEGRWQFGDKESMTKRFAGATSEGIICAPSALGAELFLWAFAQSDKRLDYLFSAALKANIEGITSSLPGVLATKKIQQNNP